ncbi:hypothetical protein JCM19992_02610 [Thermostilla marina]
MQQSEQRRIRHAEAAALFAAFAIACAAAWGRCDSARGQCVGGTCRVPAVQGESTAAPPVSIDRNAIVRVVNRTGPFSSYGSGAVVGASDAHAWVLTCAHLFAEGIGETSVLFPDGSRRLARVRLLDRQWDVALLETPPLVVTPLSLAERAPQAGEVLYTCGYGSDGRLVFRSGKALGYVGQGTLPGRETLAVSGAAREGDSGGPVLDARGRVVAVLWGTDGSRSVGTYCGRLRRLIGRVRDAVAVVLDSGANEIPESDGRPGLSPDAVGARLDALAAQLREREQEDANRQAALGKRLETIEAGLAAAARLQQRIETAEARWGEDNVRQVVRQVAADVLRDRGANWLDRLLPALLTALGWSGPPSLAIVLAARLALRLIERRLRERLAEEGLRLREDAATDEQGEVESDESTRRPQS